MFSVFRRTISPRRYIVSSCFFFAFNMRQQSHYEDGLGHLHTVFVCYLPLSFFLLFRSFACFILEDTGHIRRRGSAQKGGRPHSRWLLTRVRLFCFLTMFLRFTCICCPFLYLNLPLYTQHFVVVNRLVHHSHYLLIEQKRMG